MVHGRQKNGCGLCNKTVKLEARIPHRTFGFAEHLRALFLVIDFDLDVSVCRIQEIHLLHITRLTYVHENGERARLYRDMSTVNGQRSKLSRY